MTDKMGKGLRRGPIAGGCGNRKKECYHTAIARVKDGIAS